MDKCVSFLGRSDLPHVGELMQNGSAQGSRRVIPCRPRRGRHCAANIPWWQVLLLCFVSAGRSVKQWSHKCRHKKCLLNYKQPQPIPFCQRVVKVIDTPFTERPMFTCPVNKVPLGGSVATSCPHTEQLTFSQPLISIPLLVTPYLQTLLTCVRVGRAGWLTGWLGAHGPRLWLE